MEYFQAHLIYASIACVMCGWVCVYLCQADWQQQPWGKIVCNSPIYPWQWYAHGINMEYNKSIFNPLLLKSKHLHKRLSWSNTNIKNGEHFTKKTNKKMWLLKQISGIVKSDSLRTTATCGANPHPHLLPFVHLLSVSLIQMHHYTRGWLRLALCGCMSEWESGWAHWRWDIVWRWYLGGKPNALWQKSELSGPLWPRGIDCIYPAKPTERARNRDWVREREREGDNKEWGGKRELNPPREGR